jgi:hypothetical protein
MARPSTSARVAGGLAAAALVVSAVVVTARGQGAVAPLPIPHEDLTPPAEEAERTARRARDGEPVLGPEPTEFQNPAAIKTANSKLLPEPDREPGAPVFGEHSAVADRMTESRPDRNTGADGTLHYTEVFNPSVVPFKRMSALDAVRADYTLYTDSSARTAVPVGGKRQAGRELFWGSMSIKLRTGRDVAIPSVSPDMEILSYETEPRIQIAFSKDRADNFFVRTDEPGIDNQYSLVFLVAARSSHFAPQLPRRIRIRDLPRDLVRPMPPAIAAEADQTLREMRLHPDMTLEPALNALIAYYRSFEAKDPPDPRQSIYRDLHKSQAGVCRHRSFAFMITANRLGIPTRYLSNEAHAWVEVYLPRQGWARVDLGGAALRLEVSGAEDKAMHQPAGEDPFPKPSAYEDNYTQLVGDISGLTDEQIAERRTGGDGAGGGGSVDHDGDGEPDGDGDGDGDGDIFAESDEAIGPQNGRDSQGRLIGPGRNLPAISDEELAGKIPTRLSLTSASTSGYRGEKIAVSGHLYRVDRPGHLTERDLTGIGGQRVNIFMGPAGDPDKQNVMVGYAITGADGTFDVSVEIPTSFDLARYAVYAATPGSDAYAPAVFDD